LLRRITNWAGDVLSADVPGKKQLRWSEVIFKESSALSASHLIGEEASLLALSKKAHSALHTSSMLTDGGSHDQRL
jgi:hypothetical protein